MDTKCLKRKICPEMRRQRASGRLAMRVFFGCLRGTSDPRHAAGGRLDVVFATEISRRAIELAEKRV